MWGASHCLQSASVPPSGEGVHTGGGTQRFSHTRVEGGTHSLPTQEVVGGGGGTHNLPTQEVGEYTQFTHTGGRGYTQFTHTGGRGVHTIYPHRRWGVHTIYPHGRWEGYTQFTRTRGAEGGGGYTQFTHTGGGGGGLHSVYPHRRWGVHTVNPHQRRGEGGGGLHTVYPHRRWGGGGYTQFTHTGGGRVHTFCPHQRRGVVWGGGGLHTVYPHRRWEGGLHSVYPHRRWEGGTHSLPTQEVGGYTQFTHTGGWGGGGVHTVYPHRTGGWRQKKPAPVPLSVAAVASLCNGERGTEINAFVVHSAICDMRLTTQKNEIALFCSVGQDKTNVCPMPFRHDCLLHSAARRQYLPFTEP